MRFRFLHAADLHLDTPFTGMRRVDASLVATLRDATTRAFDNLVNTALEHSVAFVVIAGDIYDGPERGVRAQLAFRNGLDRLAQAGIRSFVVHGNHDPLEDGWSAIRQWPDGVTVFGSESVATAPVERDGQTLALIHGISYARRETRDNLALGFRRDRAECFQVGVLHCNAGAKADYAPYSPCAVDDLVSAGLDYWALGHVHLRQFLHEGGPWIAYPGNPQGLSPKPSELGAKGALLVDVDDGRVARVDFLPLDVVRFDAFDMDIAELADVAGLVDTLIEAARTRAAAHDGRTVVLRVSLTAAERSTEICAVVTCASRSFRQPGLCLLLPLRRCGWMRSTTARARAGRRGPERSGRFRRRSHRKGRLVTCDASGTHRSDRVVCGRPTQWRPPAALGHCD